MHFAYTNIIIANEIINPPQKISTYYNFNKGGIYQVSYVSNEYIGVREANSYRLEKQISFIENHPSGYPYIFDFFVLESEYLALERDKQINNILE